MTDIEILDTRAIIAELKAMHARATGYRNRLHLFGSIARLEKLLELNSPQATAGVVRFPERGGNVVALFGNGAKHG